jgi:hypothetical protein
MAQRRSLLEQSLGAALGKGFLFPPDPALEENEIPGKGLEQE